MINVSMRYGGRRKQQAASSSGGGGGGGSGNSFAAMLWGAQNGGSTHTTYTDLVGLVSMVDASKFALSADKTTLTCQAAGTYTLYYFGRGGYNTSGTAINLRYRIYQNSTIIASATNVANSGTHGSISVTCAAGDTIHVTTSNSSNSANQHDFGILLEG